MWHIDNANGINSLSLVTLSGFHHHLNLFLYLEKLMQDFPLEALQVECVKEG